MTSIDRNPGENIIRIVFHLPTKVEAEKSAVLEIEQYLREAIADELNPIEGFTISAWDEPIYKGVWYLKRRDRYYRDYHSILYIDLIITRDDDNFHEILNSLHDIAASKYINNGVHQKVFWILTFSGIYHRFHSYEEQARRGQKFLEENFVPND